MDFSCRWRRTVRSRARTRSTCSEYRTPRRSAAYLPDPDTVQYEGIAEDVVAERSINAINDEMQEIGYEIDPDDPDLLIKTHVLLDQEENLYADPVYGSYNYYYPGFSTFYTSPYYYRGYSTIPRVVGYDIDEVDYTEGAMIVDIIDAETNEVVWRGYAGETVSPANFITDLNSYVDQIFDEYPVEDA